MRLRKKGLTSKLNAKDEKGKTALDWAIERFLALALNPEITKLDPKTPISDLKIPLLNLQLNESDQQMKKEYEEVVRWLLLNSKKTCGQEAMRTKGNNESYSLISRLEPHPAIHLVNRRDLLLQWQKEGIFQLLALEDLQALLIPKKLDIL